MKLNRKNRKNNGFTLVELLLGMSLTVLVGGVLYLLQSTGMATVKKGTTQLLLTSEIRNNMERIVADLRNSKEILEVQPGMIKVRTYKFDPQKPEPGEAALVTVTYELEKVGRRSVLWRVENRENPVKLMSIDEVEEKIFFPFWEVYDKASPIGWSYFPYDMVSNDSGQRKKISLVKIKFSFRQQSESSELITSVNLRPATSRMRQPHWKYR